MRWLVMSGLLGLLAKTVYRPIVRSSGINDLGVHGVLPSFFWAMFCSFLFARYSRSPGKACLAAFAANAAYEIEQVRHDGIEDSLLSSVGRTFDPWDLVAAGAACGVAYLVLRKVEGTCRDATDAPEQHASAAPRRADDTVR